MSTHATTQILSFATALLLSGGSLLANGATDTSRAARTSDARDINYAILLSISEEVETAPAYLVTVDMIEERRLAQAVAAQDLPAVPTFDDEGASRLAQSVQLATAHRLRGETIAAAEHYAQVMQLSQNPIHAFFYAEAAAANGDAMLAAHLRKIYSAAKSAGDTTLNRTQVDPSVKVIRLAGVISDINMRIIANASIRIFDPIALIEHTVTSDANGLFVVDGLSNAAELQILAQATGFDESEQTFYVNPENTKHAHMIGMRIYLQPTAAGL